LAVCLGTTPSSTDETVMMFVGEGAVWEFVAGGLVTGKVAGEVGMGGDFAGGEVIGGKSNTGSSPNAKFGTDNQKLL
jgi:hypothetical protein